MSSRERRRGELRKRKARRPVPAEAAVGQPENGEGPVRPEPPISRSEARNEAARAELKPLREDERPGVVTVGAVISSLLFASTLLGYAAWDALRDDPRPALGGLLVFTALTGAMAYGMWRARYWAALGFQTFLLFVLLGAGFGLIQAERAPQVIGNAILLTGGGTLFWKMVKAMARIQMPQRLPRN